jgi:hypothetical protein
MNRKQPTPAAAEYTRKLVVAAGIAAAAWTRGGLDEMEESLRCLRRAEADPVVLAEVERLYHRQCLQVA